MAGTRFAWRRVWLIGVWLVRTGERLSRNLTGEEWGELRALITKGARGKSRRTPWRNLTDKERDRVWTLVRKAVRRNGRK